jgi:hypothetical protein
MATIRRHATNPEREVCLESCRSLAEDPNGSKTERSLAAEVMASFELTNAVADMLGLPQSTDVLTLAKGLRGMRFRITGGK